MFELVVVVSVVLFFVVVCVWVEVVCVCFGLVGCFFDLEIEGMFL